MSRVVIPKMQTSGELSKASEREITEEIEQSERLALVLSVATGAFAVPALALLMAAGLKVLAWLFGRKSLFIETLAVVSVGLMPIAVLRMLILVSAARQTVLAPDVAAKLVPVSLVDVLSGPFSKAATGALTTLNFFHLWSVLLIGFGFAAAARMKPWQALLISLVVYLLMAGAFGIGVPALMSGGGGPGGRS